MFTNATVLELYARARRDDDLREIGRHTPRGAPTTLAALLRRVLPHRAPAPAVAPLRSR